MRASFWAKRDLKTSPLVWCSKAAASAYSSKTRKVLGSVADSRTLY